MRTRKIKTKRISIGLVLIFLFCGCDLVYPLLDKEGAEEKKLIGEIIPNQSNPIVEEAQTLLYVYGYNTGRIDGVLGLRTRQAIAEFQTDAGIKKSRYLDDATWSRLNAFRENGMIKGLQLDIPVVQSLLKAAGFDPGDIDGKMGDRTIGAVRLFQEAHGLKVDGKIGFQTLSELAAFLPDEMQVD